MQAKLVLFSLVLSYITSCSTINKYSIGFKDSTSNETSKKRSADSFDDTEPSCKLSRSYAEEFDDPDKVYIFRELYDCIYECQSKRLKNLLLENCKGNAKSDKWLNKISRHKINGQNQTSIKNEFPLLHTAIISLGFTQERSNFLEIIKVLVKHLSIDVNNTHNGEVDAPLFYALDSGDPKVIQVLLAQEDINIHITDKCGHSLFGLARYSCNCSDEARITILQALLKKHGVTCKDHDIDGELLKLACKSRDEHLAKYLMDNRSIKISSDYLHTIIHTAINSGRKAIVNALLNSESNVIPVNEVDQYGNTPLYLAVEKYLEAKNDLEAKNYFDEKACQDKASMSILNRLLAESRVNVNQEITLKGYGLTRLTALHKTMIRYGSNNPRMANVIKAFIANERFDVNQKGEFGRRCELIHTLVQKEGAQALRILKDIVNLPGIDPNVPDQYGNTPLHYIILKCLLQSYGSLSVLLNNSKVQLNQKNEHGHIPFDYLFFLATRDLSGMDSSSSLEEKRIAIEAIKAFLRQGRFIVNNKQAMLNTLNSSDISLECRIDRIKALYSIPNPRRIPDGINRFCSHY